MSQSPGMQGLPPLKRTVGSRDLRILGLNDSQRRKFLRVSPAHGGHRNRGASGPRALLHCALRLPFTCCSHTYSTVVTICVIMRVQTVMFCGIDARPGGGFDWERLRTALGAREAESK
jgi:hypothetical protein